MKTGIICIFIALALITCQCDEVSKDYVLVESYNARYLEDSINNWSYDYYVGNNVILPKHSNYIFYHDTRLYCGTGWKVTDPPRPLDFESTPMYRFKSVDEFVQFLDIYQRTPRLVMLVSDSDTISNENYFRLKDSLEILDNTYIISTRKITPDEETALANSNFIALDMNQDCDIDKLDEVLGCMDTNANIGMRIRNFLELSQMQCRYNFDYQRKYEEVLFDLLCQAPIEFVEICDNISIVQRGNISFGIEKSYLVDDNLVKEAYELVRAIDGAKAEWILESIDKRK